MSELLERILEHEGFSEKPYLDTVGVWTIGHGLTFITAAILVILWRKETK